MSSFSDIFERYNWDDVKHQIYSKTSADVERALNSPKRDLGDFMALVSPAAGFYLEPMARLSQQLTQKRFGKTIQMYIPLYLSNECNNICTYCGFSLDNKVKRRTLNPIEIMQEAAAIKELGYDHVLLVSGEANQTVHVDYFRQALKLLRPHFSHISMEVQPLDEEGYLELISYGLNTVLI